MPYLRQHLNNTTLEAWCLMSFYFHFFNPLLSFGASPYARPHLLYTSPHFICLSVSDSASAHERVMKRSDPSLMVLTLFSDHNRELTPTWSPALQNTEITVKGLKSEDPPETSNVCPPLVVPVSSFSFIWDSNSAPNGNSPPFNDPISHLYTITLASVEYASLKLYIWDVRVITTFFKRHDMYIKNIHQDFDTL